MSFKAKVLRACGEGELEEGLVPEATLGPLPFKHTPTLGPVQTDLCWAQIVRKQSGQADSEDRRGRSPRFVSSSRSAMETGGHRPGAGRPDVPGSRPIFAE